MENKLEKLIKMVFDIKCLANDLNDADDITTVQKELLSSLIKDLQDLGLKSIRIRTKLEDINDNINNGIYSDEDWESIGNLDKEIEEVDTNIKKLTYKLKDL
jgi:hypothetical protein